MGIRVDREALLRQLEKSGKEERKELYFHRRLLEGSLPLSIGGGLGQSRLCMLLLHKAHIGEIQASMMQFDCAPTILHIFGLEGPQVWTGRPMMEVFE